MPDIDSLNLQVVSNANKAISSMNRLQKALNKLKISAHDGAGLDKIASRLSGTRVEVEKLTSALHGKFNKLIINTDALTKSNDRLTNSYAKMSKNSLLGSLTIGAITRGIAKAVTKSNQYTENLNLFTVSMGAYADEAGKYAEKVAEVMGIDPSNWIRNQGVFMTLATGFGVASDRAYIMSKNLTQLGYDLSSFFNISYEDAFEKLQSGIAGELEPLRRLGYDLSQARLEAIALSLGIDKTFSSMTQAEKAQLRYYAVMTQVTTAQGDMARTLEDPANQLRILQAQSTQAARAIGNVFIPILNAVLPYAIAAAKALRLAANAFATFFGFSLPEVDFSGISSATGGVGDLKEELDGASGSAKKLKNALMGFDEINKLPDVSSGGGGGAGGGTGGEFDFELPTYDFLGDAVSTRVDEIMAKLQPAIYWFKENLGTILPYVESIGGALLTWKVAKALLPDLGNAFSLLGGIKDIAAVLLTSGLSLAFSFKLDQQNLAAGENISPGQLIASELSKIFGSVLTGGTVAYTTGSLSAGVFAAAIQLGISTLLSFNLKYDKISNDGYDSSVMLQDLQSVLNGALVGAGIGFVIGGVGGVLIGAGIGAAITLAAALHVNIKAAKVYQSRLNRAMMRTGIALTANETEDFIEKQFNFDVKAAISIIDSYIQNTDTARDNLSKATQEFEKTLVPIMLGVDVDKDKQVADVMKSLNGEGGVIQSVQNLLNNEENQLKAIITIAPPISNDKNNAGYAGELLGVISSATSTLEEHMIAIGTNLGDLLQKSITSELSASEAEMVSSMSNTMLRVEQALTGVSADSQFYTRIANINWSDLDGTSFLNAAGKLDLAVLEYVSTLEKGYTQMFSRWQALYNAYSELKVGYEEQLNIVTKSGDTAGMEMYSRKIAEVESDMSALTATMNDFNMSATINQEKASILGPLYSEIQAAIIRLYPEFMNLTNEQKKVKLAAGDLSAAFDEDLASAINTVKNLFGEEIFMNILSPADTVDEVLSDTLKQTQDKLPEFYSEIAKAFTISDEDARKLLPVNAFSESILLNLWDAEKLLSFVDKKGLFGVQAIFEAQAQEAGIDISKGLVDGMSQEMYSSLMSEKLTEIFGVPIEVFKSVNKINSPSKVFADATEWIVKAIVDGLGNLKKSLETSSVFTYLKVQFDEIKTHAQSVGTTLQSIPANTDFNISFSGYSTTLSRINKVKDAVRGIASTNAKITIKAAVDSKSRQFLLKLAEVTEGSDLSTKLGELMDISAYARGGFPKGGEVFIANEAGPELVGRIGNKTAVANDEQIGDVILSYMERNGNTESGYDEDRLAAAIVRGIKAAGLGTVNLDGKRLAQSINRETQRSGRNAIILV